MRFSIHFASERPVHVTSAEIIDVVDVHDVVIGQASRAEAHAKGLRHRAVHILVFDNRGSLYLQQRSFSKDTAPGLWDTSAAGHVDAGETYRHAAARELSEELGLPSSTPLGLIFSIKASAVTGFEFVDVYRCTVSAEIVPDAEEILQGRFVPLNALKQWVAHKPNEFAATFLEICVRLGWANLGLAVKQSSDVEGTRVAK